MSKLVLFIHQDRDFANSDSDQFACDFRDRLNFSPRIGEQILIANLSQPYRVGFVAIGQLAGFTAQNGQTFAQLTSVQAFPDTVDFHGVVPGRDGLFEVSDALSSDVIEHAVGNELAEAAVQFGAGTDATNPFSAKLGSLLQNRCSFSNIKTNQGEAFIIRPLADGGMWRLENFLFLDPEIGVPFLDFAWSVGPRLEIIIDARTTGPGVADTVNRTGLLMVSDATRPDKSALAWHFDQFTARIAAGLR